MRLTVQSGDRDLGQDTTPVLDCVSIATAGILDLLSDLAEAFDRWVRRTGTASTVELVDQEMALSMSSPTFG